MGAYYVELKVKRNDTFVNNNAVVNEVGDMPDTYNESQQYESQTALNPFVQFSL
jgi:hypothetical protein